MEKEKGNNPTIQVEFLLPFQDQQIQSLKENLEFNSAWELIW